MIQPMPPTTPPAPLSGTLSNGPDAAGSGDETRSFATLMAKDQNKGQAMEKPSARTDSTPESATAQPADEHTEDIKADTIHIGEAEPPKARHDVILTTKMSTAFTLDTPQAASLTDTAILIGSHAQPAETRTKPPEKTHQAGATDQGQRMSAVTQDVKAVLQTDGKPSNTVIPLQTAAVSQSAPASDKSLSLLERAIAQTHAPPQSQSAQTPQSTAPTTAMKANTGQIAPLRPENDVLATNRFAQAPVAPQTPKTPAAPEQPPAVKRGHDNLLAKHTTTKLSDLAKPPQAPSKTQAQAAPAAHPPTPEIPQNAGTIQRTAPSPIDLPEGSQRVDAAVVHLERASGTPTVIHTPPVTSQSPEQARHIAQQLAQAMPTSAPGTTEITLSPEELGRVRMSITLNDGAMTLTIQAERPETSDLMRRNIEQLAQTYRQMGFTNLTFNFDDTQQERSDASPQSNTIADEISTDEPSLGTSANATPQNANGRLDLRI